MHKGENDMMIGVIGGTGFYQLLEEMTEQSVATEYGEVTVLHGTYAGKEVVFLPRHGKGHNTLAPYINYRANLLALHRTGVERILAVSAVGAINREIQVGSLSLLSQFVDLTRREKSYGQYSVDITDPFCPQLRDVWKQAAQNIGEPLRENTTRV
jgi:5'-methylthioadenosine phosphorylase